MTNEVHQYRQDIDGNYDLFRISNQKGKVVIQVINHWEEINQHDAATIVVPLRAFNNIIYKLQHE